jgi:pyruvate/2-oxoglutarate dehydrogenase complex dihydrolipoamide acyltransferase (E2) component
LLQRGKAIAVRSSVTSVCRAAPLIARLEDVGLTGSMQPVIIYEAARLMQKYPVFNAIYDEGRIGLYGQVNVGWALDGGHGLVVPVIPAANQKSLQEIAEFMDRQLEAYLENTLTGPELAGATFTVTDLSGYGTSFFDPLIIPGQSAILGIGKGPDYEGQSAVYLILAFDHQVTEGKKAAQFLQDLRERLAGYASSASAGQTDRCCMMCHRDEQTLRRLKVVLLKSEIPPGLVCSLCVAGW